MTKAGQRGSGAAGPELHIIGRAFGVLGLTASLPRCPADFPASPLTRFPA